MNGSVRAQVKRCKRVLNSSNVARGGEMRNCFGLTGQPAHFPTLQEAAADDFAGPGTAAVTVLIISSAVTTTLDLC
jgi:hypothetical protein